MDDLEAMEQELVRQLQDARSRGWRDADLRHSFRRHRDERELLEQVAGGGSIEEWRADRRLTAEHAARVAHLLITILSFKRPIPPVDDGPPVDIDAGLLGKVRALLAKAESTEFELEAESLYAKAHELMARYSIDQSLLNQSVPDQKVCARRVLLDEPYAYPRFVLLARVAEGFGCRVLAWTGLGLATVFGMGEDVEATELLYTSLLLQATTAMLRANAREEGTAPSTVAAFRRAFLIGFANRVGDRLSERRQAVVTEAAAAAAAEGDDLLPVLASRSAAVDAAFDQFASGAKSKRRSVSNISGLVAGDAAGATASLTTDGRLSARQALGRGSTRS